MDHLGALFLVLMCVLYLPLAEVFPGFQKCSRDEFECRNRRCVSLRQRCDGADDCGDGSDETCGRGEQKCSASEFRCANGNCVRMSWRCDHSDDCRDGSDEQHCDQNECAFSNGGCSHLCVDLPFGFMCDCPSGMRLIQDTQCGNVDHCLESDLCDQICIYSNESLSCECEAGYNLTPGTGHCRAAGAVARMVVHTREGVKQMDLSGSEEQNITSQKGSPGPVAVHKANNTLYWAGPENHNIYRISVGSGEHTSSVLLTASSGILGLAVDEVHEQLYWVSTSTHALHVASLNGSGQRRLISDLSTPTAVAVQPVLGHLFWADSVKSPKIERSGLDGHHRVSVVSSFIRNPVALSLDTPRGLLYWADSGLHSISRVAFDGTHRKTVVESNGYLDRPYGLAVFESRVYWTDQLTKSICSANKHNGDTLEVSQNLGSVLPAGLAILQSSADEGQSPSETSFLSSDWSVAGILSVTVFLSVLLVGAALYWLRSEFRVSRSVPLFEPTSLKESQDPLLLVGPPVLHEHRGAMQNGPTQCD